MVLVTDSEAKTVPRLAVENNVNITPSKKLFH